MVRRGARAVAGDRHADLRGLNTCGCGSPVRSRTGYEALLGWGAGGKANWRASAALSSRWVTMRSRNEAVAATVARVIDGARSNRIPAASAVI